MKTTPVASRPLTLKNGGSLDLFFLGVGSAFTKRHYQTNLLIVKGDEHQLAWMHPVDGGVNYHGPAVSVREGKDGIDLQWHDSKLTCQRSQ